MKTRYRILQNKLGMYRVQYRNWYWPFWVWAKIYGEGTSALEWALERHAQEWTEGQTSERQFLTP